MPETEWVKTALIAFIVVWGAGQAGFLGGQDSTPVDNGDGGIDIGGLIDGTIELTAKRMFLPGTQITNEAARVYNDGVDEGYVTTNTGTVSASPKDTIKMYVGFNSSKTTATTYYVDPILFEYPAKEVVKKSANLCYVDTAPSITTYDENEQVQTTTANAQAFGSDQEKTLVVKIQAAADKCYGAPSAPLGNAMCFKYPNAGDTDFTKVKATTGIRSDGTAATKATAISLPQNVSTFVAAGSVIDCYRIDKVADNSWVKYMVELKANGNPTVADNVSIYLKDISFDISQDDSSEIYGFEDEDNNPLGAVPANHSIRIS